MTLEELQQVSPFAMGGENVDYAQYFNGTSYLNMLSLDQVMIGNVTFTAGCRNHWHIHHAAEGGGQILIVTAGHGWYQAWGEEPQALHAGDIVHIPANVKHWHGAAKNSAFQHLAIEVASKDTHTEWCELLANDDYNALP